MTIAQELEAATGREVIVASVYAALDRLEERGLVRSTLGDPTPERGGRAKRYFQVTAKGIREAQETRRSLAKLWRTLPDFPGERA